MKLASKIAAIGSAAALASCPVATADGGKECPTGVESCDLIHPEVEAGGDAVEVIVPEEEAGGEVIDGSESGEGPTDVEITGESGEGEVIEGGDGEVTHCGEAGEEIDPAVCGVPLDWVKRGGEEGENPEEMFYNMADGGAVPTAAGGGETPLLKGNPELGQDEKSSAIEAKGRAASPQIQRDKKGPVALLKKGRVFLR